MRGTALAIALTAIACVSSATEVCDGGRLCPEGTTCYAVAATQTVECVTPDQLAACADTEDGTPCPGGTCYSGACLPAGCGNARMDASEACDDGNVVSGDGCSTDCRSAEVCGNGIVDPIRLDEMNMPRSLEQCDDGGLRSHDGCASTCLPELQRWQLRGDPPKSRHSAAMAFDEARRRVILFGGLHDDGARTFLQNDTWAYGRDGWAPIRTALAPLPRMNHAMAYDGTRVVLFGGSSGVDFDDTWVFERDAWVEMTPPVSPMERFDHAMAYMPGVGIVLFGGATKAGSELLGDTWVYRDGEWTLLVPPTRPPARARHGMAYDPLRDRVVLVSGADQQGFTLNDTWEFDGTTWTAIGAATTPPACDMAIAFDRVRGKVVVHGGLGSPGIAGPGMSRSETDEWNGTAWTPLGAGPTLSGEAASVDPETGRMVMFGGVPDPPGNPCSDCGDFTARHTSVLDGTAWDTVSPPAMTNARHAGAYDPDRRRVVVYGGENASEATLELGDGHWRAVFASPRPPGGIGAAMAFAGGADRGVLLVARGETWRWNGVAWQAVVSGPPPVARMHHAMVYDAERDRVVLYGGTDGDTGTWEWDGTTWTNRTAANEPRPPARSFHAMAYDPIRKNVLLFGGSDPSSGTRGDTWRWDGTTWTELQLSTSPSPRAGAAMAWDEARQRIVLYGQGSGDDVWEWDGTSWSFISLFDPPPARIYHVLVSSPTGAGVLAIGGRIDGINPTGETAHLTHELPLPAPLAACRSDVDDDEDGAAGCADPDCWTTCSPWCPPGTMGCDPAQPRCGDGRCDAPRETCGICADCACP